MAGPDSSTDLYIFGRFRLDPKRRLLIRDDAPVALTSTVLDVLIYLVEHPGRIVTKDELLDAVWPERIVEESNVKQAVFTLRKALGGDSERMIVTAPGRGYRLAEDVRRETASDTTPLRQGPTGPPPVRGLPLRSVLLIALCLVGVVGAATAFWRRGAEDAVQGRIIVLADFENRTGEPVFDRALASLLRIDLGQSPFLDVVSERQAQQTLTLMTKPRDAAITPALAEEICTRNNGDAVVQGGIASIGARYFVTLTATDCSGTRVIAGEKDEVRRREEVAPAIDRLIAKIRSKLGEPHRSIEKFNVPLLRERTASLDALKDYSEAKWLFDHGHLADAISLDRQAIEIDPQFSAAYANLGVIYAGLYDDAKSAENLSKAYALRDITNQRQKLQITALYDQFVTKNYWQAIRNFRAWTEIYPQDAVAWSNLANAEDYIGMHAQAVADGKRSVALKPKLENPYTVLARAELGAGQPNDGLAIAMLAVTQGLAADSTHRELLRIAAARHDAEGMLREENWANNTSGATRTQEAAGEIALSRGKVRAASAIFDRIAAELRERGTYDHVRPYRARLLAELGLPHQAALLLAGPSDGGTPDPDYLFALAEVGDANQAEGIIAKWLRTSPSDTLLQAVYAPEARGALALRRGEPRAAIAALTPSLPFASRSLELPYLLGSAWLAAGNGVRAAAAYRTVLAHPGWSPESPLYPLAKLGLARALKLEHDVPGSAGAYRAFLADWKDADPDLPLLETARLEYGQLVDGAGETPEAPRS